MVLSLERWVGKVAIVTGASSGIGEAISERLVKEGLKVVGLARRKEKLDSLAQKVSSYKGSFNAVVADMTKEEAILNAFKWVTEQLGPIHILINNAGVFFPVPVIKGNTEGLKTIFDTNVIGLTIATREAIDSMNENNIDGHIINIGSIAGHYVLNMPVPLSIYTASKHAVTALAESIRIELVNANSKIKITNISPGAVATEMIPDEMKTIMEDKILQAEDISDGIVYVLSTPPHVQVHELMIRPVGS